MSIKKCCENCVHNDYINLYGIEYLCCESFYGKEDLSKCYDFAPKEEVVREDERNKMLKLFEDDPNGHFIEVLGYIRDVINGINVNYS